jgi:diguanylate cyclase
MSALPCQRATTSDKRKLFDRIGAFLAGHDLSPTPGNYALAWRYFAEPGSPLAAAVGQAIADGVRLGQAEADALLAANAMRPGSDGAEAGIVVAEAQAQLDAFAEMVESTREAAHAYGRDLAAQERKLQALPGGTAIDEIVRLTGAMIARSQAAEQQLASARAEAQTLRERLERVEDEARRDPLTRLPNRRAFEDRIGALRASGACGALAICDIDHFKRINDGYGHAVGDRVLRMVAQVLEANCAGQFVARLGGEEFVVLFDDAAQAAEILDEARIGLGARRFRLRESDAPLGAITFSAGLTALRPGEPEGEALGRADRLLYVAKDSGRDAIRHDLAD